MIDKTQMTVSRRRILAAGAGLAATPLIARLGIMPAHAEAPMLGGSVPTFYRFKIGGFECTTVRDGALNLDGPHPIFGQDQPAEAVEKLAKENQLPPKKFELSFTPLIVNTGTKLVMFDSGNGAARRPDAGKLAEQFKLTGYTADQVDVVVITHCHPDHIGGLMEAGKPLFPNARYVIGQVEYDFWSPEERLSGGTAGAAKLVQANVVPLADKMTFLKDDGEVVPGIRAVSAFGHTPGHMGFHIESDGERLLLMADTTNHYVVSLQRPDWHVKFDMNKDDAAAARKKMLGMAAADRIPVTGYHFPFPAVGYIEAQGESFRYVPATYQLNL